MTDNERLLLLLVADALLMADARQMLDRDARLRLRDARHAIDVEAHAAPQSALQAGQGRWACPRCGHDLEASIALLGPAWKGDAASNAHIPGTGKVG